MPNAPALRQIVAALRGLVFKARDAGSPPAATVLTMAAGAVQDIASAQDGELVRRSEQIVQQMRQNRP